MSMTTDLYAAANALHLAGSADDGDERVTVTNGPTEFCAALSHLGPGNFAAQFLGARPRDLAGATGEHEESSRVVTMRLANGDLIVAARLRAST